MISRVYLAVVQIKEKELGDEQMKPRPAMTCFLLKMRDGFVGSICSSVDFGIVIKT